MENLIQINIDELNSEFLIELKKKFKHKHLEIRVLDDTELLLKSEKTIERIKEARKRSGGLKLEDVVEKYSL